MSILRNIIDKTKRDMFYNVFGYYVDHLIESPVGFQRLHSEEETQQLVNNTLEFLTLKKAALIQGIAAGEGQNVVPLGDVKACEDNEFREALLLASRTSFNTYSYEFLEQLKVRRKVVAQNISNDVHARLEGRFGSETAAQSSYTMTSITLAYSFEMETSLEAKILHGALNKLIRKQPYNITLHALEEAAEAYVAEMFDVVQTYYRAYKLRKELIIAKALNEFDKSLFDTVDKKLEVAGFLVQGHCDLSNPHNSVLFNRLKEHADILFVALLQSYIETDIKERASVGEVLSYKNNNILRKALKGYDKRMAAKAKLKTPEGKVAKEEVQNDKSVSSASHKKTDPTEVLSLKLEQINGYIHTLQDRDEAYESYFEALNLSLEQAASDYNEYAELLAILAEELEELKPQFKEAIECLSDATLDAIGVNKSDEIDALIKTAHIDEAELSEISADWVEAHIHSESLSNELDELKSIMQIHDKLPKILLELKEKGANPQIYKEASERIDVLRYKLEGQRKSILEGAALEAKKNVYESLTSEVLEKMNSLETKKTAVEMAISAAGLGGSSIVEDKIVIAQEISTQDTSSVSVDEKLLDTDGVEVEDEPQVLWEEKITDVKDLVHWGDGDPGLSYGGEHSDETAPKQREYRYERIRDMIGNLGISNDDITRVYRQDDAHVIDLHTQAGRAQILVADWKKVIVIRDDNFKGLASLPLYRSEDELTRNREDVEFLLNRKDVWTFNMPRGETPDIEQLERAQSDLAKYLFTPKNELPVQRKHRVYWGNRGSQIERSLILTVIATGVFPKSSDTNAWEYGDLANVVDATPSRANQALSRNTPALFIKREDVNSLRTLWKDIVERQPELESFVNMEPISVEQILSDCQRVIKETGFVACNENAELFNGDPACQIANHSIAEIQKTFEYGLFALQGAGQHIPADMQKTRDFLAELQVEHGIAVYNTSGELVPLYEVA